MSSKISEINQNLAKLSLKENLHEENKLSHGSMAYSEIPGLTDPTLDVLNQLKANMTALTDLHQRLQFTIKEIKSVIR